MLRSPWSNGRGLPGIAGPGYNSSSQSCSTRNRGGDPLSVDTAPQYQRCCKDLGAPLDAMVYRLVAHF